MRHEGPGSRNNPDAWKFEPHGWEKDYAIKLLIQVIAFNDGDARRALREQFHMLEDKRPHCPQCGRRGCEPWNHDPCNSKRVCIICYEQNCSPEKHAEVE